MTDWSIGGRQHWRTRKRSGKPHLPVSVDSPEYRLSTAFATRTGLGNRLQSGRTDERQLDCPTKRSSQPTLFTLWNYCLSAILSPVEAYEQALAGWWLGSTTIPPWHR